MKYLVIIFSLFLLLSGCIFSAETPVAKVPDKYFCEQDSDCIIAILGCCPCSSGGQSEAVNVKWLKEYDKTKEPCGIDLVCTQSYHCFPAEAVCNLGKCELNPIMGLEP